MSRSKEVFKSSHQIPKHIYKKFVLLSIFVLITGISSAQQHSLTSKKSIVILSSTHASSKWADRNGISEYVSCDVQFTFDIKPTYSSVQIIEGNIRRTVKFTKVVYILDKKGSYRHSYMWDATDSRGIFCTVSLDITPSNGEADVSIKYPGREKYDSYDGQVLNAY